MDFPNAVTTLTAGPVYIGGEPPAITPVGTEKFSGTAIQSTFETLPGNSEYIFNTSGPQNLQRQLS